MTFAMELYTYSGHIKLITPVDQMLQLHTNITTLYQQHKNFSRRRMQADQRKVVKTYKAGCANSANNLCLILCWTDISCQENEKSICAQTESYSCVYMFPHGHFFTFSIQHVVMLDFAVLKWHFECHNSSIILQGMQLSVVSLTNVRKTKTGRTSRKGQPCNLLKHFYFLV